MRIRTIKPEFWGHPVMGRLDDAVRCLALGLLNFADDEGYFYADAALVRSALRPFDEDSTIVRRCLDELSSVGWIDLREAAKMSEKIGGHGLIGRVSNFAKHQRIDRPKSSSIKGYWDSSMDRRTLDERSTLEQGTGNREQGTYTGLPALGVCDPDLSIPDSDTRTPSGPSGSSRRKKPKGGSDEDFERFWAAYPRKVKKIVARKAWMASDSLPPVDDLIDAVRRQASSEQWRKDGGDFIPHPSTWLRAGQWEDALGVDDVTSAAVAKREEPGPDGWRELLTELYPDASTSSLAWHSLDSSLRRELSENLENKKGGRNE